MPRLLIFLVVTILAFAVDTHTKNIADDIQLHVVGLDNWRYKVLPFVVILVVVSLTWMWRMRRPSFPVVAALGGFLGGGSSNLYDSLSDGSAVNWFTVPIPGEAGALWLNLADLFIVSGALAICSWAIPLLLREIRDERAANDALRRAAGT